MKNLSWSLFFLMTMCIFSLFLPALIHSDFEELSGTKETVLQEPPDVDADVPNPLDGRSLSPAQQGEEDSESSGAGVPGGVDPVVLPAQQGEDASDSSGEAWPATDYPHSLDAFFPEAIGHISDYAFQRYFEEGDGEYPFPIATQNTEGIGIVSEKDARFTTYPLPFPVSHPSLPSGPLYPDGTQPAQLDEISTEEISSLSTPIPASWILLGAGIFSLLLANKLRC